MKIIYFTVWCTILLSSLQAQVRLVIPGDFADPSVVHVGDTYYAAGTSSEWAPHFPIFKSKDLIHWDQAAYAFKEKPTWTSSSFWAPELFYYQGKYFLYYTARKASDGTSCIGVATSDNPENGFTDRGILLEHGKEAIDGFVIQVENQLYISWKAYGLDKRPIELMASKLSNDGLHVEGTPFTLLKDEAGNGMEGQCIIKHDQYYYLFYSVGACCGSKCSYAVQVARATSIEGPFVNHPENPLILDNAQWKCPGHGTLVQTDKGKWSYLYHAYSQRDDVYTGRQALLNEMTWSNAWPVFKKTVDENSSGRINEVHDDFQGAALSSFWQWDFRNSTPKVSIKKNVLSLTGTVDTLKNKTGSVLTVRPYSGNYEMTVSVDPQNASSKGLTVYGDAGESAGIGIRGEDITIWQVHKNEKSIIASAKTAKGLKNVNLKMVVTGGYKLKFFWSRGNSDWNPITTPHEFLEADFLPQWDRSPRPGLFHQGNSAEPGNFSAFKIKYTY